jgi:hypothetical protein
VARGTVAGEDFGPGCDLLWRKALTLGGGRRAPPRNGRRETYASAAYLKFLHHKPRIPFRNVK